MVGLANREGGYNRDQVDLLQPILSTCAQLMDAIAKERERIRAAEDLNEAKEAAESANRTKSQFLATMSHEIRTPMNGVLGMLQLLEQTALDDGQQRFLSTAVSSSELLLNVINDILDYSKLGAGKLDLESIEFDPVSLVEETVALFAKPAQEKGLELICSVDLEGTHRIKGDPTRLRQVLTNLLGNAIKFTDSGHVALYQSYVESDNSMHFGVVDTGIGLSEQQQSGLFKAFSQADSSHTRKYGGTGLGLAISQSLVKAMGGEITVTSIEGRGSDFHFDLPGVMLEANYDRQPISKQLTEKRFLIAEDNIYSRQAIERLLISSGIYRGDTAIDGDDLLAQVRMAVSNNYSYDVILFDTDMPGISGAELVRSIHQAAGDALPLIVGMCFLGEDTSTMEIDACISKPIRQSVLLDTLLELFGEAPQFRSPNSKSKRNYWFRGRRLLLVEDNAVNQEVAFEILKRVGLEIDICENGELAVSAVQNVDYDLVLMDIQMPVMDGLTATERIRALGEEYDDLPIIAMTAHAMASERIKSFQAGMNAHVNKPIDAQELFREIARWVAQTERPSHGEDDTPMDAVDIQIPDLAEVDTTAALDRLGGNVATYVRILTNYCNNNGNTLADLESCLEKGDLSGAATIAHTLKGGSGNIGAMEVFRLAADLEQQCRNHQPEQAEEALNLLRPSLLRLLDDLGQLSTQTRESAPTEPALAFSRNRFESLLAEMTVYMDNDVGEALSTIAALRRSAAGSEYEGKIDELEQALNSFDIDTAKSIVGQII